MKLIIDIPEDVHNKIIEIYNSSKELHTRENLYQTIANGKPYEERPQGEWAKTGQSFVNPNKFRNYCCSNCFYELDEHIRNEPNFCPNCGADMRGEKK